MNSNRLIIKAILSKGTPSAKDILYILYLHKKTSSQISQELNVSKENVAMAISGKSISLPVAKHIAWVTGISIRNLFGTRYDRIIKAKRGNKAEKLTGGRYETVRETLKS